MIRRVLTPADFTAGGLQARRNIVMKAKEATIPSPPLPVSSSTSRPRSSARGTVTSTDLLRVAGSKLGIGAQILAKISLKWWVPVVWTLPSVASRERASLRSERSPQAAVLPVTRGRKDRCTAPPRWNMDSTWGKASPAVRPPRREGWPLLATRHTGQRRRPGRSHAAILRTAAVTGPWPDQGINYSQGIPCRVELPRRQSR